MNEADIIAFAKIDPQPFHVDPVAAKDGPYGGIIASGWHTTSMMMRPAWSASSARSRASARRASTRSAGRGRSARATRCTSAPSVRDARGLAPPRPGDGHDHRRADQPARRPGDAPDRHQLRPGPQPGDLTSRVLATPRYAGSCPLPCRGGPFSSLAGGAFTPLRTFSRMVSPWPTRPAAISLEPLRPVEHVDVRARPGRPPLP